MVEAIGRLTAFKAFSNNVVTAEILETSKLYTSMKSR